MRIGQVTDLSPQNFFHKLEVQISCWILWAQTNLEHIFTSWIHTSKPTWWTEPGSSKSLPRLGCTQPASPISSNQALQVAHITSITSSIPICPEARQSCHSHHHGLSRRDVFLAKRKRGDAFLECTSCSCASYISSYFSCCELKGQSMSVRS